MFGKLLKKVLGKKLGTIADHVVDEALDKRTGGLSSKLEREVKKRRRRD